MSLEQAYTAIRLAAEAFEKELNRHNLDIDVSHKRIDVSNLQDNQPQYVHEISVVATQRIK